MPGISLQEVKVLIVIFKTIQQIFLVHGLIPYEMPVIPGFSFHRDQYPSTESNCDAVNIRACMVMAPPRVPPG